MSSRFITTWRKPSPNQLEWDYYVSDDKPQAERVVENILKQGVHQYATYELGPKVNELSSKY